MNAIVLGALAVGGGFLVGSIPFGVLVSRLFFHRDIRAEGSGNIGAANALRTLGKKAAAAVLAVIASGGAEMLAVLAGLAAVIGHCYSPFLRGRGGKGVATSYGVIWALAWPAAVAFTIVWIATIVAVGFSSVASMLASAAMPFALWFMLGRAGLVYGVASAILIVYKHRENIARLRAGTETTLSFGKKTKPGASV